LHQEQERIQHDHIKLSACFEEARQKIVDKFIAKEFAVAVEKYIAHVGKAFESTEKDERKTEKASDWIRAILDGQDTSPTWRVLKVGQATQKTHCGRDKAAHELSGVCHHSAGT
jgi:hypothetical protein